MERGVIRPVIPPELVAEFSDSAIEAHERMASTSLEDLCKDMPATEIKAVAGQWARYTLLKPQIEHDPQKAVVVDLPHANALHPHIYLRLKLAQEIAAPNTAFIVFPGHRLGDKAYDLSREEMSKVVQGDLSPIAERHARVLQALRIGWLSIEGYSGYSGGVNNCLALGKVASDYAYLQALGVFEAPNVKARTKKELEADFKATGWRPFLKSINDAQMPALRDALGVSENSLIPRPRMIRALGGFLLATKLIPENGALIESMLHDNLTDQILPILKAQPTTQVLIGNAENSRIMPTEDGDRHYSHLQEEFGGGIQRLTVSGYGHEMADNIVVHALLVKKSLNQAFLRST